jgi:hypothetical protein
MKAFRVMVKGDKTTFLSTAKTAADAVNRFDTIAVAVFPEGWKHNG